MWIDGWKYYNHAALPSSAPHEPINEEPLINGSIWKIEGKPLLARYQSEWDCGYETEWWYEIKDTPFDITNLKSKRRYEIKKGQKNFRVSKINAQKYIDELYDVTVAAYSGWPEKYCPIINKNDFFESVALWTNDTVFAGFDITTGKMAGYARLVDYETYVEFSVLRTKPDAERLAINAAIVAGILDHYNNRFNGHFYINDGSRAIRHETAFQDYLEKYFEFRKAYCRLNIKYKFGIGLFVKCVYPFRKYISDKTRFGSNLSGILKMEEIKRSFDGD